MSLTTAPLSFFVGGISQESNSWIEIPTLGSDFARIEPDAPTESWFIAEAMVVECFCREIHSRGHQARRGSFAWAETGGLMLLSAYRVLRERLLEDLQTQLPVSGVLLALHGGMAAESIDDCELDLIASVREIVGDVPIGVLFDLHCDVSPELIELADVVVTLKEYPHTDYAERAAEVAELVVGAATGDIRPVMAIADCRTAGNMPTTRRAMRALVDETLAECERVPNVLSASLAHGNPWLDSEHYGSRALVIADGDKGLAAEQAAHIAAATYAIRHEAVIVPTPLDEAISTLRDSPQAKFLIAEAADNPGGGSPGDATHLLSALLASEVRDVALGPLYDPDVVRYAIALGVGQSLEVRLGGKLSKYSGPPLDVHAQVIGICRNLVQSMSQDDASLRLPTGDCAAIRIQGVEVVVSSQRAQAIGTNLFTDLGVDLDSKRVVAVKSANHFRAAFDTGERAIIIAETEGSCRHDLTTLHYKDMNRFPWKDHPDLATYGS